MIKKEKKSFHFWQELKRRGVPRVLAMYAATAFIVIEASEALNRSWQMIPYYDHKHFTLARKVDDLLYRG